MFMTKHNTGGWTVEDATKRRAFMEKIYEDGTGLNCVIQMKDTGAYAGVAGFRDLNWWNRSAEMGIILHPDYWSKGLATEIHLLCLQWAFEVAQLHRIEFKTSVNNIGMNHLCREVMKANLDGVLRDYFPSIDCTSFRIPTCTENTTSDSAESPTSSGSYTVSKLSVDSIKYESVNIFSILSPEWEATKTSLLTQMTKQQRE